MATCKTVVVRTYDVNLTREERAYLMAVLQNSHTADENVETAAMRKTLFEVLARPGQEEPMPQLHFG